MMLQMRAEAYFNGLHLGSGYIREPNDLEAQFDRFAGLILAGDYADAYKQMRAEKSLTDEQKKQIINAINEACLFKRQLEWGNHGVLRSFRFWNAAQKTEYLRRAVEIAEFLKAEVTPYVSFGFGSVLGYVRDNDFIPHDDDMDLIIALPVERGATFAAVKLALKEKLEAAGFTVKGDENLSHVRVVRGRFAGTDVFIGFIDPEDTVSWFPTRRGISKFSEVFPAKSVTWFGVDCPMPAVPEKYVAAVYGEDWRTPLPNWNHPWDRSQYREFL